MNEHAMNPCTFLVDGKEYNSEDTALNGQQIKEIAGISGDYQLFLEEAGDSPDRQISDGDLINVSSSDRCFYAVPPATFG